ncbi:hypothetical protein L1987_82084 [Smallanthus sonchifolius]|uniref:Uncharacterized protein n=1 Tax=Smallanthus sonchifolius TaxID=185202 RepID=A0ACB8YRJ9_9ASTR|nr:hypothetical protein L1987_82084 [Smallanthus sonchifolius]
MGRVVLSVLVLALNLVYANGGGVKVKGVGEVASSCITSGFTVHIESDVNNLMLHCQSKDDDLGEVHRNAGGEFDIKFCMNAWRTTLYFCHFYWQSKQRVFNVFALEHKQVPEYCYTKTFWRSHCYWKVKADGFYVPTGNDSDPTTGWVKKYDW